ncbi:MAG: NHL repeat-containing protein [Planctomyces sp.]|nr:NHL repeat-containing protein [Planctomyces sp.]
MPDDRVWTEWACSRRSLLALGLGLAAPSLLRGDDVSRNDAPTPRFLKAWGEPGSGPGQFHSPIGIAMTAGDELLVSDLHNHRVQRFTAAGEFLSEFPVPRHPDPNGISGGGIAVGPQGAIYVSLMTQHQIAAFSPQGELVRIWGRLGAGERELHDPGGLAVGPDGNLYVADQANHRVQAFTPEGEFVRTFGVFGAEPGQFGDGPEKDISRARFGGPHWVAFNSRGELLTTEGTMRRVQRLTTLGVPLAQWGDDALEPPGFGGPDTMLPGPIAVCVDRRDRVWVGGTFHRVQLYHDDGRFLTHLGAEEGDAPGRFSFPHGLAIDSQGCLYVADSGNQRIQKFAIDEA